MAKQKSRFPSYGLVRGPSHKHGGVAGVVAGEQPVELEGGEWIIPKEVVPDYLPVLKQITNEGRAIQNMDNGNSAMDALIASASMETGLSQPKSPMYQEGGVVDILKQAMAQYGQPVEEGMYTPQGGRTELGYAKEHGLTPESVNIDTLSFRNPANYLFRISGEKPSGETITGTERATGALPLKMDVGEAMGKYYKDDPFGELDATIALKERLEAVGRPPKEDKEKQMMMKALGMSETEYDAFMAWKKKNKQQGGPVDYYQNGGQADKGAYPAKDIEMLEKYPTAYKFFMDRRGQKSYYPEQDTLAAKMFRGEINPNEAFSKALMLPAGQEKGQAPPRKHQEMRNPTVYGPPVEMMGPAVDTTGNDLQHMLNQLMMRDHIQRNPFTGDTIDTYLDSLRLKQRMDESMEDTTKKEVPWSPYRKKARQGGPVMYQEGGMVGQQQAMGPVPQGSLMGAANGDARIRPLTPDTYITKLGEEGSSTMEIPKLSTAYLESFGMETPLSKQQGASLHQKGITPDTLNPSVKGLINRVLVQRLANEDE